MPIHASGLYDDPSSPKLDDFAISSYIPSLNSLIDARARIRKTFINKMLIVGQTNAPGMQPIPYVEHEMEEMQKSVPEGLVSTLCGSSCTINAVLAKLPETALVHFACHGTTRHHPLESALFLHDGELTLGRLIYTDLKAGSIAVLNACQTAAHDPYREDQVANLATGLLAAGFSGVVATLWYVFI